MESAFSVLVGAGQRWGQVKTYLSLRLKVALTLLAHPELPQSQRLTALRATPISR